MAGEQLRVTEGQDVGQTLPVESEILFGRGSTDEVGRLGDDPLLSRRHARIGRGPGGQLIVEDFDSANGTFVNDQRIDGVYTLALGDRVRVGGTVFQVTDAGGNVPGKTRLSDSPPLPDAPPAAAPAPAAAAAQPAPPAAPGEELVVTGGLSQGKRLTLENEVVLGRMPAEQGGLGEDPGLSRRHARVFRDEGGRLAVEDLGSANGTFVNGQRISEPRWLSPGDSVRVGQTTLEVVGQGEDPGRGAAAAPPTVASPAAQPQAPPPQPQAPAPQAPAPSPQSPGPQSPGPQSPQSPQSPQMPPPQPVAQEAQTPALPQEQPQTPQPPQSRSRQPDPPGAMPPPQSPPAQPQQQKSKDDKKSGNVLAAIGLIGVVILLVLIIIALG